MPTYRNPYANHPLLRKGGVHVPSKTGQRVRHRESLLDEVAEYMDEYFQESELEAKSEDNIVKLEGEQDAPFSYVLYGIIDLIPVRICY
jgi:hypothetical protein